MANHPGIDPNQLVTHIIRPALAIEKRWSFHEAEILLVATSAQETHCGEFLAQIGGPALGIFQCEPHTHDLVANYLEAHMPHLALTIAGPAGFDHNRVVWDLLYATRISRALYWSDPAPLPPVDMKKMWAYYKRWYNSSKGAAKESEWEDNWNTYVKPLI